LELDNMRKFIVFILIFTFIFPFAALADDLPVLDIRKCIIEGKEYVGFLPADAQTLLQYRIDIPKLRLEITSFKDLVKIKDAEINTLASANSTLLETKSFLTTENVRMQKEIDNQNAWYKSPYLWFSVGLIIGTAATVTVVYLVK